MLSRLISLLRRIPAVEWAFTRLRPSPHSGSINDAPQAADDSSAIVADITEAAPALDSGISADLSHRDDGITTVTPVAEDETAISAVAENPVATPTDVSVSDDSSRERPTEVEPIVVEEVAASPVEVESESEPVDAAELISSDPPAELATSVDLVITEEAPVSSVEVESAAIDAPLLVVDDDPSPDVVVDIEPAVAEDSCVTLAGSDVSTVEAHEGSIDCVPSPDVTMEIEPVPASDPAPVAAIPAEASSADTPSVITEEAPVSSVEVESAAIDALLVVDDDSSPDVVVDVEPAVAEDSCVTLAGSDVSTIEAHEGSIDCAPSPGAAMEIEPVPASDPAPVAAIPAEDSSAETPSAITSVVSEPVLESPAPVIPSAPKTRAKVVEPVDRATLIRQRWTETGIRMWNPRLHGTGDATLNIQGRVELLPPAPGETMPRYDKLEFRMLGGQIVCEGVIVEAPESAGQRSFTRLAEPRSPDRAREPVRERQAALA
ncbi:hypothetical protein [Bradyrhizobium sp. CCGB20]|uniref:hypothetical protein n=1 Tax=Bradyrhizobium sp. CCGB20 TaxID=2949633 RepID=UPI0020B1C53A|nr:hypothetical protein [Bradyrhizobium sp. CCGB20]MCP3401660.1 hypothetical protein [Bradyrhizobium sp. CCGB20]